jgi:outer membrane biosynthesis protein TonB
MKRFLMILLVAMLGLVLACGSEEEKAPAKTTAPSEKVEEGVPQPPLVAPEPPKAVQPEAKHPKADLTKPKKTNPKKKPKRKPKKAKPKKVQQSL